MSLKKIQHSTVAVLLLLFLMPHAAHSVMQSSNYKVEFDSINFAGGHSSSANYQMQDTAGEIATGDSSSENFQMRAGYQQMNTSYIAISANTAVHLGDLPGLEEGAAATSTDVNVVTDSYGGYQMTVHATTDPALTSGVYYFDDYTPTGVAPDYTFGVDPTSSEFGFSVSGSDAVQRYRNNGSSCNAGSSSTPARCWDGFTTTPSLVSQRHSSNHPNGTDTRFDYQAGIGSAKIQAAGTYSASIVITATAL